ncbi:MAG: M1 family aminopeptidase [Paludisphaera borealis]|uniref:M1 family aminopeptidase n=1 Tax=Paludisphaera borealis TaxID=1387353 RepID=UPI0028453136|nr:M1 family aminopeptidase [Paludisphaera borealis]MDR3622603.1 M1 family aminopeptidase [Paludisphaera borealis]
MGGSIRFVGWWMGVVGLSLALMPRASAQGPTSTSPSPALASPQILPTPQTPTLPVPPGLPRYDLSVRIDPQARKVRARERLVFTNRSKIPVHELVMHVYPRFKVPEGDKIKLAKTMEVLRLSPEEALDPAGRRLEVTQVSIAGAPAGFEFDPKIDTIMVVPLKQAVAPGGRVESVIDFTVDLPEQWGRWGSYEGITYLLNWYPVLAFHDDQGWRREPFVPWHQPWHQEAGHYRVIVDLPADQVVASTGRIVDRKATAQGWQRLTIETTPVRDFALVCSNRFQTWERQVGATRVKVHGCPEHAANAQRALDYACEVIPQYEKWFGPYADTEFEIAPSFFGWNGNECSGLVLLDDRVMRLPTAGQRYIEHLVTHETCHQWWWNTVGADGYAETFMDEGLVNCFTALRLDAKYGRNGPLIVWPKGIDWLPTIGREDMRMAGYYGWRRKGGGGSILQNLDQMGNLGTLFSLAYDRGGKVVEMIHNRLGEERFFAFFRKLYHDHAFENLSYAEFKRDLAAFDPQGDWPAFLEGWVENHHETDWAIDEVKVAEASGSKVDADVRQVTIDLEQRGKMEEPTELLVKGRTQDVRVPIVPGKGSYDVPGGRVTRDGRRWRVTVETEGPPRQVEVDPGHALLDAQPDDNRWKPEVAWKVTPMVTPLDLSSQFQAHDRISVVAGPFIDQYARGGVKAGVQRINKWQVVGWAGTEPALREAIFGGEATLFHLPKPNWAAGFFYEQGLYNFYNDKRHSGGRAYLRKRLLESSSFIVDDPVFYEFYYGLGNEFWQGDDGRPVEQYLGAVGARYRQNTQFPYWDPVQGQLIDVAAEYGNALWGSSLDYVRVVGQYGFVKKVPESWGILPHSRFAFRGYGGWSSPGNASMFRLGGGQRLRALDLTSLQGSSVWIITGEWRFPIWRNLNTDVVDHMVSFRNLYGAAFVDIGQSYLNGHFGPIVYGPGVGLRWDAVLFSFLERATLRVDVAQPLGVPGGPVIWFGINQVF